MQKEAAAKAGDTDDGSVQNRVRSSAEYLAEHLHEQGYADVFSLAGGLAGLHLKALNLKV